MNGKSRSFNMYNDQKALAAITYLLKLSNGICDKYWLNKILYYIERESLILSGQPMFFDDLYSIKYGPIVSIINDQIDQTSYAVKGWVWTDHIQLEGNWVKLLTPADESVLSPFEEKIITEAYKKFRGWSFGKLKDYFHALKEHHDTDSRIPIYYEDILKAEGFTEAEIEESISEIKYFTAVNEVFSRE